MAQDSFVRRCAWGGCGLGVELGYRRSAACVCERGDAAGSRGSAATAQRVVGKDLSARAGRVVCGDAEDVYTVAFTIFFSVHVRDLFSEPLLALFCPSGGMAGRQQKKSKFRHHRSIAPWPKGSCGRERGRARPGKWLSQKKSTRT